MDNRGPWPKVAVLFLLFLSCEIHRQFAVTESVGRVGERSEPGRGGLFWANTFGCMSGATAVRRGVVGSEKVGEQYA